jgi:hypothetical protein
MENDISFQNRGRNFDYYTIRDVLIIFRLTTAMFPAEAIASIDIIDRTGLAKHTNGRLPNALGVRDLDKTCLRSSCVCAL